MIFAHLVKHWRARREQYSLASWVLCIVRCLRVLAYYRQHRALCELDVVRNYVAAEPTDDLFNHLSHRDYLARGLTASERVACALTHYSFEEATFGAAYKLAVYRAGGLLLWRHQLNGSDFTIKLAMASRLNAEGDLVVIFEADGKCLHRLSFSWVEGALAGIDQPIVPFLARNQGRWTDSDAAFAAFEQAFPNNSPSFFCFAAMQGLSQAVGLHQLAGVKSAFHVAYEAANGKHFVNAYDGFWRILGGAALPGKCYLITLPFYVKPLADMPGKHRKRAALRRENWRLIGDSARRAIARNLLHARSDEGQRTAAREPAEV
jgi:uncharacterized protein VirK/YbjX